MSQPQNPGEFDAVLGGTNRSPEGAAVLGGIQGLLIHYQDPNPHNRIEIIQQALNYGKKGTDFLLEVMKNDDSWEVKDAAYELLLSKDSEPAESTGYIDTTNMPQAFLKLNSLLQVQNFKEAALSLAEKTYDALRKLIKRADKNAQERESFLRDRDEIRRLLTEAERYRLQAKGRWKAWDRERHLAASLQEEISVLKRKNEETRRAIKIARKRLRDDQNRVLREAERRGRKVKVKSAEEILKEWGIK